MSGSSKRWLMLVFLTLAAIPTQGQTAFLIEGLNKDGVVVVETIPLSPQDAQKLEEMRIDFDAETGPQRGLPSLQGDQTSLSVVQTLKPPVGPFNISYAKGTVGLNNRSVVSPDEVHSLPNGDPLHVAQDYLANSAALAVGHDVVVTSAYRDPDSGKAHAI